MKPINPKKSEKPTNKTEDSSVLSKGPLAGFTKTRVTRPRKTAAAADSNKKASDKELATRKASPPLSPPVLKKMPTAIINLSTNQQLEDFIDFIKNPNNQHLLKDIESVQWAPDTTDKNVKNVQKLLNLLSEKSPQLPKLTSLSLGNMLVDAALTIIIPPSVTSFSLGSIDKADITIENISDNLVSLYFRGIYYRAKGQLHLPSKFSTSKLESLHLDVIPKPITNLTPLPSNLKSLVMDYVATEILNNLVFPETLKSLSCGNIGTYQTVNLQAIPKNCTYLSVGPLSLNSTFNCSSLPEGIAISIEDMNGNSTLNFPKVFPHKCTSISFKDMEWSAKVNNFPDTLPIGCTFSYGDIENVKLKSDFDKIKAIQEREIRKRTAAAGTLLLGFNRKRAEEADKNDEPLGDGPKFNSK